MPNFIAEEDMQTSNRNNEDDIRNYESLSNRPSLVSIPDFNTKLLPLKFQALFHCTIAAYFMVTITDISPTLNKFIHILLTLYAYTRKNNGKYIRSLVDWIYI